ncbi:MAG: TldD/PmbA family protein [Candidatus Thorarchaeota archaeon]
MNIQDIAQRLVSHSEKAGATQAEAYSILVKTSSIYIDDNIPKIADTKTELGVGLKLIIDKKIGFTSSTLLSEDASDVVSRAKSLAEIANADQKFISLPDPKKVSGKRDKFSDKDTAEADSSVLIDLCMELVNAASSSKVSVPNGVLRASSIDFQIINSLGVDTGSESTMVFGYFTAKAEDNGSVGEGVQRIWSRSLKDTDFTAKGEILQTQALDVIKSEPFKDNWDDIVAILAPSEGSEMMGSLLGDALSAENVNNRSSPWTDRVGDKVAHESLNVVDNGLSEKGLLSAAVDDEGTPTAKTIAIENGTLRSYLFDSYNAQQHDLESTGNGLRRGYRDAHGAFTASVSCRPTTIEIPAGKYDLDSMISEIKRGIYVEHFAWPQVDSLSGAFSNEIRNACLIENGELTTKVKYALLAGNLYESLKKEILFGNDLEVNSRYVMPTMGFAGVELVGQ